MHLRLMEANEKLKVSQRAAEGLKTLDACETLQTILKKKKVYVTFTVVKVRLGFREPKWMWFADHHSASTNLKAKDEDKSLQMLAIIETFQLSEIKSFKLYLEWKFVVCSS